MKKSFNHAKMMTPRSFASEMSQPLVPRRPEKKKLRGRAEEGLRANCHPQDPGTQAQCQISAQLFGAGAERI